MTELFCTLLGSFLTSCVFGVIAFHYRKEISEVFHRHRVNWNDKRRIAKTIIDKLSVARFMGYESYPSHYDQLEILRLASHMRAYDKQLSEKLDKFVNHWVFIAMGKVFEKNFGYGKEVLPAIIKERKKTHVLVREIIDLCNKFKN